MQRVDVFECTPADLSKALVAFGEKSYRAKQIWKWIYCKHALNLCEMTDISKEARDRLKNRLIFTQPVAEKIQRSNDGTIKFLFVLADQSKIETVYIPEGTRGTICLSSQVGCALKCRFCHTGTQGLTRNLSAGEIVQQVLFVKKYLRETESISFPSTLNIVFMGMGEPFNNYDSVAKAVHIMMDPEGLAISRRRITISTSGILPFISRCAKELRVNLAISLHAVTNELRNQLMPINRKYPLEDLIKECRHYQRLAHSKRITFEYVMLQNINDKEEDAAKMAELLRGISCIVNLIPFNKWPTSEYECTQMSKIGNFASIIKNAGCHTTIRASRGRDILGACGQLKISQPSSTLNTSFQQFPLRKSLLKALG
jgi:23S rRNA (adenine2503-C2)-methyltransferase